MHALFFAKVFGQHSGSTGIFGFVVIETHLSRITMVRENSVCYSFVFEYVALNRKSIRPGFHFASRFRGKVEFTLKSILICASFPLKRVLLVAPA